MIILKKSDGDFYMKSGIMSNNKITKYELVKIIKWYGLVNLNVTYDESSFKVCMFGKIGDDIFYEFDSRSGEVKLRGKIPESVANQFDGGCDSRYFFDNQFSKKMVNIMHLFLDDMNELDLVQKEKSNLNNRDVLEYVKYVSELTIHSPLELIKFIEAYSNLFRDDILDDVAEKSSNEILVNILLNEIKLGITVEEWIKGNGAGTYSSVRTSFGEKSYSIFVDMLEDSLSAFEKAVNPFIGASKEDVLRLLVSPNIDFTPIKIEQSKFFKHDKYISFGFLLKGLVKNELSSVSFKRRDRYKFSLEFQNSFFLINYTNEGILFEYDFGEKQDFDIYKTDEYGHKYNFIFSKIDEYSDEYIEEVIKLINEVTLWVTKLVRDNINGKSDAKEKLRTVN